MNKQKFLQTVLDVVIGGKNTNLFSNYREFALCRSGLSMSSVRDTGRLVGK